MADYEAAIVFSCLVHSGCPIDPPLLQHMLAREPRESFSPGIMADLQSALQLLEQQQQQGVWQQQGVELQLRLGLLQQQQYADGSGAGSSSSSRRFDPWYDEPQQQQQQQQQQEEVEGEEHAGQDLDALIDQARSEIGAQQSLWQQQQQSDQGLSDGTWLLLQQQQQHGGSSAEESEWDSETARRIGERIAIVEELFHE
jgi:hypothetical protein